MRITANEQAVRMTGPPELRFANANDAQLNVTVLFTSVEGTMAALRTAGALASKLGGRITIVVPEVVPYHLPINQPPVLHDWNEKRFRVLAAESSVETSVRFYLCRDEDEMLARGSSHIHCWFWARRSIGGQHARAVWQSDCVVSVTKSFWRKRSKFTCSTFFTLLSVAPYYCFSGPSLRPATSSEENQDGLHYCRCCLAWVIYLPGLCAAATRKVLTEKDHDQHRNSANFVVLRPDSSGYKAARGFYDARVRWRANVSASCSAMARSTHLQGDRRSGGSGTSAGLSTQPR